jgi:Na+:H+ antiporter, NhaA family
MTSPATVPHSRSQPVADKILSTLDRFLHVEALSGIVLLIATAAALIWANSPAAHSYHAFWETRVALNFGALSISESVHFLVNDGLMTIFFLVVGLEIRREIHEGALATTRLAALPLAAALGGVLIPALIYLAINTEPALRAGWAVPTATDIAFAVGVLALLGKAVPANLRVLLLALAVIDDIAAVVVIALFYSEGVRGSGFVIAALGILLVTLFQRAGIRSALAYVIPGAVVWIGALQSGVHPTLAGVVLGLMTPVHLIRDREQARTDVAKAFDEFCDRMSTHDTHAVPPALRLMRDVQRELLPPVTRVQLALHPWVAFGIMPLFALANAGISFSELDVSSASARSVAGGIVAALVIGKIIGIVFASWLLVRTGWGELPEGVTWRGVGLVGCLGGIGFTMAIFVAGLAFSDAQLLGAAKLGVLVASGLAGLVALCTGSLLLRQRAGDRGHQI